MNLLSVENVSKAFGLKKLFENITMGIETGDKIGLIGVNGTGKSTFLKILAGIESPDQGKVTVGNAVRVEYLPQNPAFDEEATVLQQVFRAASVSAEVWQIEGEAKTILTKLGIFDFETKVGTLSGGQRKRVALASALVNPADLLILDEPTNHIDNDTVAWLEQYLNRRKGALLMITHDRYFLDRVVNRIIELDRGRLFSYEGNYSKFLELKSAREERERSAEDRRLNLLRNELKWIKRGARARTTKQKARIERFEKLQAAKPGFVDDKIEISMGATRLGKKVIVLEHITKGFADRNFIEDFSYIFLKRDRVGIVGPNGYGKSTLLNIIAGKLEPDSGTIDVGHTVKVGYFSQENQEMDDSLRVIDYIKEEAEYLATADGKLISASQMLERFLFSPELQWNPIAKLSGGERRRLFLLRVLMAAPNLLLLDEPTNDLDIQTLTILEDYLDDFPGAVIAVSHDRYFLDRVAEKILAFSEGGKITEHIGNYSEYMVSGKALNSFGNGNTKRKSSGPEKSGDWRSRPRKFSYKEQREYEEIDDKIAKAEEELAEVKVKISQFGSDYVALQELLESQRQMEKQLDELLERWVYLNDLAEQIEQ